MLQRGISSLRCPICRGTLSATPSGKALSCESGHSFDRARQGYVSLLVGSSRTDTADTAPMIEARERFLASGHYQPLVDALVDAALAEGPGVAGGPNLVVEVGAGTGYYLGEILKAIPSACGIALDISKPGLRRAASLDRVTAVAADVWSTLPLSDGCASLVLDVFAPRNPAEFARILEPGGVLVVATPAAEHLGELRGTFPLMEVEESKLQSLTDRLGPWFELRSTHSVRSSMRLTPAEVGLVVGMGPNAFHLGTEAVSARVDQLSEATDVTLAVDVSVFSPCTPC